MADFKDKFSGKSYVAENFSTLSASIAADPVLDGRRHEFYTGSDSLKILPYRIKRGDQAKFFPGLFDGTSHAGIETGSIIRDTERQIVYVPIKKKNYQNNLIGVGSHISTSFASGAYLQLSAAFADLYSEVPDDTLFTFCVEEFYNSPSASRSAFNVGPLTASYDVLDNNTSLEQFSAIHSGSLPRDFNFSFPSGNFITHWDIRFGGFGVSAVDYISDVYVPSFKVRFNGDGSDTGSIVLSDNPFANISSGSHLVNGVKRRINPNTDDDGYYTEFNHKTRLAGDADSGSLYTADAQFPGNAQIIIYPPTTPANISSADFQYHPSVRREATGSSTIKTLYFYSGSGAGSEANPDYGFFVSESLVAGLGTNAKGTPLHTSTKLRRTADVGYYSPSGSQYSSSIYVQTASGATSGKGPVFAQLYETGN